MRTYWRPNHSLNTYCRATFLYHKARPRRSLLPEIESMHLYAQRILGQVSPASRLGWSHAHDHLCRPTSRPWGQKIERTLWSMNSKLASSAQAQFWAEIKSGLDGAKEKPSQNDHTAQ